MFRLTPVVKNLLIINIVVFALQYFLSGINLTEMLAMHKIGSEDFRPYQLFTYMFAHGGIGHIFFNMLGLVFLGPLLEQFWGPKRFLIFYLVTGIGAGLIYGGIEYYRVNQLEQAANVYLAEPNPDNFSAFVNDYQRYFKRDVFNLVDEYGENPESQSLQARARQNVVGLYNEFLKGSMVGASGAIYGILMAFGLLFPNTKLMLLFPPIPVKAKYLVLALGGYAIYAGFARNPNDPVAHFAHLGGMVFAFIMIMIWKQQRNKFY